MFRNPTKHKFPPWERLARCQRYHRAQAYHLVMVTETVGQRFELKLTHCGMLPIFLMLPSPSKPAFSSIRFEQRIRRKILSRTCFCLFSIQRWLRRGIRTLEGVFDKIFIWWKGSRKEPYSKAGQSI